MIHKTISYSGINYTNLQLHNKDQRQFSLKRREQSSKPYDRNFIINFFILNLSFMNMKVVSNHLFYVIAEFASCVMRHIIVLINLNVISLNYSHVMYDGGEQM